MATTHDEVWNFLQDMKSAVSNRRGWPTLVLVPRPVNLGFVSELGFSLADIEQTILDLSVVDYCSGPSEDVSERGYVWVFGKVLRGKETYIKLKLACLSILKVVRVISFHRASQPLSYPLRA